MPEKKWSDLTPRQQQAILLAGAVEAVLTTVALRDLARRPARGVRGSRTWWALACLVQPVGPLAYLVAGRR